MSPRFRAELHRGFRADQSSASDEELLALVERRATKAVIRHRGWLVRRALLAADLAGLTTAFFLPPLLFGDAARPSGPEILVFIAALAVWIVAAKLAGLYDHDEERADHSTVDELAGVLSILTIGVWLLQVSALWTGLAHPDLRRLALFWTFGVVLVCVGRSVARAVCRRTPMYLQNTAIVGMSPIGQLFAHKMQQHPEYGINLVGFVDSEPAELRAELRSLPVLGTPEQLPALVHRFDIERVVFAYPQAAPSEIVDLIRSMNDLDVQIDIVPRYFEIVGGKATVHAVEGLPLMGLPPFYLSRSSQYLKRGMDVVFAGAGLLFLLPLFLVVGLLIKLDSPGPVFFRQIRMGRRERTFRIHKFRTMTTDAEARKRDLVHLNAHAATTGDTRMFKASADPRVTRLGRLLRRYAIDELPQLIDVLQGTMSLVGPRPLILDEDQHVVDWARRRLELRPGMTGLWQVLGSSNIPFEDMTKLDYLYVANWSLWGDLRLILQTGPAIIRARRAY
jgi:exopolysaccharide biosynthesis polyprenyl glycosylphosphotransferase